jgi:hypothetical protein
MTNNTSRSQWHAVYVLCSRLSVSCASKLQAAQHLPITYQKPKPKHKPTNTLATSPLSLLIDRRIVKMLFLFFVFALSVNAAIVQHPRAAQPGSPVRRDVGASASPVVITNSSTSTAQITGTTSPPAVRVPDVTSDCTPRSICFDGRSCSLRYGGRVALLSNKKPLVDC